MELLQSGWMWVAWTVLLLLQSSSFTLVSRARNSGSIGYHALAAVFSHSTWFAGQLLLTVNIIEIVRHSRWQYAVGIGLFYTVVMLIGAVGMHWMSLHWFEKGKLKVGAS